ncbi:MAG: hypothetical protein ACYCYP_11495 [Leptospirales bacterium]
MTNQGPILILARTQLDPARITIAKHLLENSQNRLVLLGTDPSWTMTPGEQVARVGNAHGSPGIPEITWTEFYGFLKECPRILTLS